MAKNSTIPSGLATSSKNTPQAKDDYASASEDIGINIDVLGNDLGGAAKSLYSLDQSNPLNVQTTAHSQLGAAIQIVNGRVAYDPTGAGAIKALAEGETATDSFTYAICLANGTISTATVYVTVTGTNDAPVARAISLTADEDGPAVTLTASFTDADVNDTHSFSIGTTGTKGTVVNNNDGTFSYDPNGQFESLAAGQTATDTFTYTVMDNHGLSSTQTVTVTINGQNDAPAAVADSNAGDAVTESGVNPGNTPFAGDPTATGDVLGNDNAGDAGDTKTVVGVAAGTAAGDVAGGVGITVGGTYGSVVVGSDGIWTYTLDNTKPATQTLGQDVAAQDVFTYTMGDGHGGTSTTTLTIGITGTNDQPFILDAVASRSIAEDLSLSNSPEPAPLDATLSTSGTVTFLDADNTDNAHTIAAVPAEPGYLGTFTAAITHDTDHNGPTGQDLIGTATWNLSLANADLQFLAQDEARTQSYTLAIADGYGGTASQEVLVTLTGTNDAPEVTPDPSTGSIMETEAAPAAGAQLSTTGTFSFSDVDLIDTHAVQGVSFVGPESGTLPLGQLTANVTSDTANGIGGEVSWTYTVDAAAMEFLTAGEQWTESFAVALSDGHGGLVTKNVSVTIEGTADSIAAVNLDDIAAGIGGFKIIAENADDFVGFAVSVTGDVNGDGLADLLIGAQGDDQAGLASGAAYVVFGETGGTHVNLADVALGIGGFKIVGESGADNANAGWSVSSIGDMNGDGLADLLIGARQDGGGGFASGAAYVVFGKADTSAISLGDVAAGTGGFKMLGENPGDNVGISVASAGDVNGDGRPDVLVGAYANDAGGFASGAAYVVFGKTDGASVDLGDIAAGTGGFKIVGESIGDEAGWSVSGIGDINGDGYDDVLVGALQGATGANSNGEAYVVFGKADGNLVNLADVATGTGGFKIIGENGGDVAGGSLSGVGDVNGDGTPDILIGAPWNDGNGADSGAAYVVFGKVDGASVNLDNIATGVGGFKVIGENASDLAGASVSGLGDINGDGFADFVIGATGSDAGGSNSGAAYFVFGQADGNAVNLSDVAAGVGGFEIIGENAGDLAGRSVSSLGDVSGDGLTDLLIGAVENGPGGAVYVVFGQHEWFL